MGCLSNIWMLSFFFLARHVTDGSSLRFSGDAVLTQKFVQAGAGAILLIHEAIMANDQIEMARAKMYSTFGQAMDIGKRCVTLQYNHRPSLNL
jgi:ribonuclease BN (tRNA processing enzyme)